MPYVSKKVKAYLFLLLILWSGAAFQALQPYIPVYKKETADALVRKRPTVLLEEEYNGELSMEEKEEIAKELLERLDAKVQTDIRTDELYTIYAFSPLIDDYIVSEHKKINLNLLYYYKDNTDKTVLILATPIYNEDY